MPLQQHLVKFTNCLILSDGKLIADDLLVRDGRILDPELLFYCEKRTADVVVDCRGYILSPGFIDVQINGGFGFDFSSDVSKLSEGLQVVSQGIIQHGVTGFCPTLVSSKPEYYREALRVLRSTKVTGAQIFGAHLEGPFISPDMKGAHDPTVLQMFEPDADQALRRVYQDLNGVRIVTLAPELPNAIEAIQLLRKEGIVVSVGHTAANLVTGEKAMQTGASFITHLYNAMNLFHHRDPGLLGLITSERLPYQPMYGMIVDGIHTHPTAVRVAHRACQRGLVLVTDAMAAMGLPDGVHHIGSMSVMVQDRRPLIAGTTTLAGSVATMDLCVRKYHEFAGCSPVEALQAATLHPAQLLELVGRKGTLEPGSDADLVLISKSFEVQATLIAGRPVFIRPLSGLHDDLAALHY